jgi:ABC-2 type transport system ATP-binding protein
MNAPHIRAVRASKWYGPVAALNDVSFDVQSGVFGLLGPNGSGKTTLMRIIAGQLRPSLGEVRVCGESSFANPRVLARIGLCPESDALYAHLSALEHVSLLARISGLAPDEATRRSRDLLVQLGLGDALDARVATFSRGMRQRVKIAQALVHDPDILILDEPLTGTDPISRAAILDEIKRRGARGALVLFSSHVLPEIEALTEQVIVLARGRLLALGGAHEIRDALEQTPHRVRVECDQPRRLSAALCAQPEVVNMRFDPELEVDTLAPDATYEAIGRAALETGVRVRSISSPDDSLDVLLAKLVERVAKPAQEHAGTRKQGAQP